MNTTRFWLIRHGETQWNADRRLQGWLDIPLSAVGIQQARQLGDYLRSPAFGQKIDLVVASDLGRAYETACSAAGHFGLPIERHAGLRERCYGIYEGQDWALLNGEQEGGPRVNFRDPDQSIEQGESLKVFSSRIAQAFETLAQDHQGKNIMVFSHGGVIDIAWRLANGLALDAVRPAPILNASINQFAIDGDKRWRMHAWGQTEHLDLAALDDVI
ncbi:MAG TPA: histidine phosphatase family protein [Burkholderiaceae bacterium]|nr:histidine phosphatase family protein [Burkholderiaceae bacterium]